MKKHLTPTIFLPALLAIMLGLGINSCQDTPKEKANLAVLADLHGYGRGGSQINPLNDGEIPNQVSEDQRRWMTQAAEPANQAQQRRYSRLMNQQFEYHWAGPVLIDEVQLYWFNYDGLAKLPQAHRLSYWDGEEFVPVSNAQGYGTENDQFNTTTFDEVSTTRLRLELDSLPRYPAVLLEWKVMKSLHSPAVAPLVAAGIDRDVMVGGNTYLHADIKAVDPLKKIRWSAQGPGKVQFANPRALETTAKVNKPGKYILTLSAQSGKMKAGSSLELIAHYPPKEERLDVVYTKRYKINSPLWNERAKVLITSWIPWCIAQCERTDLSQGQGGLDNFVEAAKALRGEPHGRHLGYVFSNAWVHQTLESMCIALMVDPQGDKEIIAAQNKMQKTLEKWIPIILAAQEPDGYLHTAYTLRDTNHWATRWSPRNRSDHEGYVAGYFIESAINHYTLTEGKDTRLYNAAKKLSDCWAKNIGPGPDQIEWYDGHQEMEQALVRFGRFVNDKEGGGKGDSYIALAKFLLDMRDKGNEYDQSHVPVQEQYEAVGHAVRAVYNYSAMSDVAAETGDIDYQSAVMSLWNNMINKKYYVTGGVGSGETSEGFGPNYSLRNSAYCESCSSCGLIFFQHKMNLAYHDAKYADLYEETFYNALLGSLDFEGKHFYYTNPLTAYSGRDAWHVCPCCVGNIPRTLLMIPTWAYVTDQDGIYVNMYLGSTITVEKVAGTDIEMVQETDYPWKGEVAIVVNPKEDTQFTVYVRVPDRKTSELYTSVPALNTLRSLSVNGEAVEMKADRGYIAINRHWKKGDRIELEIPLEVQQITADEKVEALSGLTALRYGPIIYNVERADNKNINQAVGDEPFKAVWREDLFKGIIGIEGKWADGSDLLAIPNYLRMNRIQPVQEGQRSPESMVWIRK